MDNNEKIIKLRILLAKVYSAYETAQNNLRTNAVKVYMKHFPVIQGMLLTIHLSRLADKCGKEPFTFTNEEINELLGLDRKKRKINRE